MTDVQRIVPRASTPLEESTQDIASSRNVLVVRASEQRRSWFSGWNTAISLLGISVLLGQISGLSSWFVPGEQPAAPGDYAERTRRVLKAHP